MKDVDIVVRSYGYNSVRRNAEVILWSNIYEGHSVLEVNDKEHGNTRIPFGDIEELHVFFKKKDNYDYLDYKDDKERKE